MEKRRFDQKQGPQEAGDFVDHDAWRVLPSEDPFSLVRDMPRQKGESQNRDQPDRPGEDGKDQIERNADQRPCGPRRQGGEPASETGSQEFDEFLVQRMCLISFGIMTVN